MHPHQPTLTLTPIGIVRSPWLDKRSAPRQPAEARDVCGRIELYARAEIEDALTDLDAWTHIWVLFWFHLNDSWRAKVQPPRSEKKRGLFATRSPYRPNPLGMSVLRLDRVEGRVLHVRDLDILDQTPVLDIKPYVAYTDAVPTASAGWLDALGNEAIADSGPRFEVEFVERAIAQLEWLRPRAALDIEALARSVLCAGPAPHAYRRIRVRDGYSVLAVKDFRLRFRVVGQHIQVFEIGSGYRPRVLSDPRAEPSELTPLSVHREFVRVFEEPT
ncbi:MAG TPA: tRNA (N6-threonylcarbamoyladenosine(37)-N6)-methyltransferase TrmO [Polyangiales bacterium]|nr:tRNA (N6-threonylcarbamoyladenosine(37)-N6)-methyltransferase TrmO [Polyangiales bacterium]